MTDLANTPNNDNRVSGPAKRQSLCYALLFGLLLAPIAWQTVNATQAAIVTERPDDADELNGHRPPADDALGDRIDTDIATLLAIRDVKTQQQQHYAEYKMRLPTDGGLIRSVLDAAATYTRIRDRYESRLWSLLDSPELSTTISGIGQLKQDAENDEEIEPQILTDNFAAGISQALGTHASWKTFTAKKQSALSHFKLEEWDDFLQACKGISADDTHRKYFDQDEELGPRIPRAEFHKGVNSREPTKYDVAKVSIKELQGWMTRITDYLEKYPKPPSPKSLDKAAHDKLHEWKRRLDAGIRWKTLMANYPLEWKPPTADKLREFLDNAYNAVRGLKGDRQKESLKDQYLPGWINKRLAVMSAPNNETDQLAAEQHVKEALRDDKSLGWEIGIWKKQNANAGKQNVWKFSRFLKSGEPNVVPEAVTRTEVQYRVQPRSPITRKLVRQYNQAREALLDSKTGNWKEKAHWEPFQEELSTIVRECYRYADTGGRDRAIEYGLSSITKDQFDSEHQFAKFVLEAWPAMAKLLNELSDDTTSPAGQDTETAAASRR